MDTQITTERIDIAPDPILEQSFGQLVQQGSGEYTRGNEVSYIGKDFGGLIKRYVDIITFSDAGADETTQTMTITTGFKPRIIRGKGVVNVATTNAVWSFGYWTSEAQETLNYPLGGTVTASRFLDLYNGATEHWQLTITNITDRGFDISIQQKDVSPTAGYVLLEVEG